MRVPSSYAAVYSRHFGLKISRLSCTPDIRETVGDNGFPRGYVNGRVSLDLERLLKPLNLNMIGSILVTFL